MALTPGDGEAPPARNATCSVLRSRSRNHPSNLHAARAVSALLGAMAVLALGLLAVLLRPEDLALHIAVPECGLLPQFVFIGSYVNSDAYAAAVSVVVLWRVLLGMRRHWPIRDA